jgi:rod shape-determining protein MreC
VSARSARRRIITYALLVAGSLLLLAMSTSAQVQDVRRGVNYAFGPVQEVLAGGARAISAVFAAFTEVDQLRAENRAMAAQIDALTQKNTQLEALRATNEKLSDLLGTRKSLKFDTAAAFVVQRTSNQFERVVTLDRGLDAGIEVNDAVLAPGGALVGVVTNVYDGSSSVRLLSDTRSLVIGIDVGTRATGEVKGNLSAPLLLDKVAATETLKLGDTVTTAGQLVGGIKGMLPRDLLIGSVVQVNEVPGQFVKSALVQPATDLDQLEAVLVITSYDVPRLQDPDASPTPAPELTPEPDRTLRPRTPRPEKSRTP